MSHTSFADKCNIIGQFWLHYREDAEGNEGWESFFEYNDVSLPLAYMLMGDEPLATINLESDAQELIEETWSMLCEFLNVEEDGEFEHIGDLFDASPNEVLNPQTEEDDDEEDVEDNEDVPQVASSPLRLPRVIPLELPHQ